MAIILLSENINAIDICFVIGSYRKYAVLKIIVVDVFVSNGKNTNIIVQ